MSILEDLEKEFFLPESVYGLGLNGSLALFYRLTRFTIMHYHNNISNNPHNHNNTSTVLHHLLRCPQCRRNWLMWIVGSVAKLSLGDTLNTTWSVILWFIVGRSPLCVPTAHTVLTRKAIWSTTYYPFTQVSQLPRSQHQWMAWMTRPKMKTLPQAFEIVSLLLFQGAVVLYFCLKTLLCLVLVAGFC